MIPLAAFETVIDASGAAARIEAMLPIGVRPRQLSARTLLAGLCLTQADGRPAHLTRVHQALTARSEDDQVRPGVIADWKTGPHKLTYRQTERTFGLVAAALARDQPGGQPSQALQVICYDLLEASIPAAFKDASTSLAVDWTDMESFSRPPPARGGDCADPEASWGHRKNNLLRSEDELFYGGHAGDAVQPARPSSACARAGRIAHAPPFRGGPPAQLPAAGTGRARFAQPPDVESARRRSLACPHGGRNL
jgi:hypothetical protein